MNEVVTLLIKSPESLDCASMVLNSPFISFVYIKINSHQYRSIWEKGKGIGRTFFVDWKLPPANIPAFDRIIRKESQGCGGGFLTET